MDPRILMGKLAVDAGYLRKEQVEECVRELGNGGHSLISLEHKGVRANQEVLDILQSFC